MHEIQQSFRVNFVGPFERHDVVVDGWRVPLVEAQLPADAEDRVMLVLDRRLGLELSSAEAERFVPFLADAIAVALGYGAHPRGDMPKDDAYRCMPHVKPERVVELSSVEPDHRECSG